MSDSSAGSRLHSIEAARAFAACSVALMHAANLMRVEQFSGHIGLGGIFAFGYIGVDFFFVLSGFIITYVHFADLGQVARTPRYLWRRFSRIFPIYWVILLLSIVLVSAGRIASGKGPGWEIGLGDIAGTVFLVIGDDEPKYVGVAWSLQYELVFYLAFCLLLFNVRLGAALFLGWGALVLARALGWIELSLPFKLGDAHCLEFLFGVAVGALARRRALNAPLWLLPAVLVLFVAAALFEVFGPFGRHAPAGRLALGLASAALLATLVALERGEALRTPIWLARIGSVSYSIYLGHILFINLTYMVLLKLGLYHRLPEALVYSIALAVALTATILIGLWIELPLVRALKDWRRSPAPRLSSAEARGRLNA